MIAKGSDYLHQLEIVRQIRDTITAKDEISLPQICVIGDQSSGKSSFLSRLTGVSFPTAAKMCTKAATVVTCNRDESLTEPKYEIEDPDRRGWYSEVTCTAKAISDTQNKLLKIGNDGRHVDENRIVTDKSIKLRVTGPHVIDIIIVDLPGIQHAGETKDSITALIEQNIKRPETLNLIVSEAKQDAELIKAIELAAKYDPDCERTVRVLSKFDNFDTPDTRERAVRLIKTGVEDPGDILKHRINLGPHAVISLGEDGQLRQDEKGDKSEEKQLMEKYDVPESRAGILPLKKRLEPLFATLIKKNMPLLKSSVSENLNEAQDHLRKVGVVAMMPQELVFKCHSCLLENMAGFEVGLSGQCFSHMKEQILAVSGKITFEFATSGFAPNRFECILFQGREKFNEVVKRIRDLWAPIVEEYAKRIADFVLDSMRVLRQDKAMRMYGGMISVVHSEYQEHMTGTILPEFQKACLVCLEDERFYGTTNHYFDSKFMEDEICPQKLVDRFKTEAQQLIDDSRKTPRHSSSSEYRIVNMLYLVQCLETAKKEVASESVHADLLENQKNRLFAAVKAHFNVEKKTFVDNLLKKTKDIVIKGHRDWIERDLIRSSSILNAAEEDEEVKKLRKDLHGQIKRLRECMVLLRDVPLPEKLSVDDESGDS